MTVLASTRLPARGGPMTTRIVVDDLSQVGSARRAADVVARACQLDDTRRGTVGIIATEAATNLARHAKQGALLTQSTAPSGFAGVEVVAIDAGPGMHDLDRAFADGFSTGGTPGTGLGAIRRQADELDVYTAPGQGTIVLARVFAKPPERGAARAALVDVGAVCLPIDGETVCGDGWAVVQDADRATILLVDGLGHGASAAEAADVAIETFRAIATRSPREIVAALHDALRATRGAALAVADVTRTREGTVVRHCGVGNTVAAIVSDGPPRALPSMNGTAGLQVRTTQEFSQPWDGGALVMHTDGITTRWRADAYRGILARDPLIFAAALQRDHSRGRDDATVLVFRLRAEARP